MVMGPDNFRKLSAYVDGELDAHTTAEVAEQIARDPEAATIVAKLTSIKSTIKSSYNDGQTGESILPDPPELKLKRGIVAATVFAVTLLSVWIFSNQLVPARTDVLAIALNHYDSWKQVKARELKPASLITPVSIPDLSSAGLKISSVDTPIHFSGLPASHLTYLGSRGCRLSLFIFEGKLDDEAIPDLRGNGILADHWTTQDSSYLLLSRKMNVQRFSVLAEFIKETTRKLAPVDEEMRIAMRKARQPCRA